MFVTLMGHLVQCMRGGKGGFGLQLRAASGRMSTMKEAVKVMVTKKRQRFVEVVSADSSLVEPLVISHGHGHGSGPIPVKPTEAFVSVSPAFSAVALKKPKITHGQFAYATWAVCLPQPLLPFNALDHTPQRRCPSNAASNPFWACLPQGQRGTLQTGFLELLSLNEWQDSVMRQVPAVRASEQLEAAWDREVGVPPGVRMDSKTGCSSHSGLATRKQRVGAHARAPLRYVEEGIGKGMKGKDWEMGEKG
ncbi:hypothetical protein BJV77DRAFT_1134226 [Russula vinacea]|nr:hypothetical protein BJV77DRAFT_1134226 [Russula vinacea]